MEGVLYHDVEGSGFVEGIPGQYTNCRVWFDKDKQVVGITALGDFLPGASIREETLVQDVPQQDVQQQQQPIGG